MAYNALINPDIYSMTLSAAVHVFFQKHFAIYS